MITYREFPIAIGTASGTFLSTFAALKVEDIFISALLAVIGAVISFLMSCMLNLFIKPRLKNYNRRKKRNK